MLTRYWIAHPKRCSVGADAALLLLSRFVGNGAEEKDELPARPGELARAFALEKSRLVIRNRQLPWRCPP
jgi:hypothetical protein